MSIDPLYLGSIPNDGTGDPLRSGGQIINDNFAELDTRTTTAQARADLGVSKADTAQTAANTAQAKADAAIPGSAAGVSIAQLVAGVVPAGQLPSYVDDVLEFANLAAFPATGETGKIYIAINDGASLSNPTKQYRWSGSAYILIPASPGSTDEVAEGVTNLYFTPARVRAAPLTGFTIASNAPVVEADTVLGAMGKLQAQINTLTDKQITVTQYRFIATAGQTVFTGLDANGVLFTFTPGSVMLVTMQGLDLWSMNDYTTTGSDTLTLTSGAVAGDELSIITFAAFSIADHYTKAEDDAKFVQKTDVIDVAHGGTGGNTQAAARTGLGLKTAAVADVLGTVTQTGGAPDGSIFETGSNANGTYIKYADGTMEAHFVQDGASRAVTSAVGSLFQDGSEQTWTFPAAFIASPTVVGNASRNDGTVILGLFIRIVSATNVSHRMWATSSQPAGQAKTVHLHAIGRWF